MKRIILCLAVISLTGLSSAQQNQTVIPQLSSQTFQTLIQNNFSEEQKLDLNRISNLESVINIKSSLSSYVTGPVINRVYLDAILFKYSITEPELKNVIISALGKNFYSNYTNLIPENKRRHPSLGSI